MRVASSFTPQPTTEITEKWGSERVAEREGDAYRDSCSQAATITSTSRLPITHVATKPLIMAPQRPEFLTQLQWDTLVAIADGIIPKLTDEEATKILVGHKRAALNPATDAEILAFLQCLPSENTTFLTLIADVFGRRLPERALGELRLLLNIWT